MCHTLNQLHLSSDRDVNFLVPSACQLPVTLRKGLASLWKLTTAEGSVVFSFLQMQRGFCFPFQLLRTTYLISLKFPRLLFINPNLFLMLNVKYRGGIRFPYPSIILKWLHQDVNWQSQGSTCSRSTESNEKNTSGKEKKLKASVVRKF
jgi:hypothetical protein